MFLLTRILALAIAAVIGIAAVLAAGWNGGRTSGLGLETWLPADPAMVMAEASGRIRSSGAVPPALTRQVNKAGRLDPFEEEPFLIAALAEQTSTSSGPRLHFLEAARRRDPRNPLVRIFLLDEYLRLREPGAAVTEVAVLLRLLGGGEQALLPVLTNLVADPDTRQEAVAAVTANPLRPALLRDLANANASPYLLLSLAPDLAGAAGREAESRWLPGVIEPYVKRGDIATAWQLWQHFQVAAPAQAEWGRVGDFGSQFGPPFGWALTRGPSGIAEARDDRLHVTDYGRAGWNPARRLLRLPAGRYRLAFSIRGTSGEAPDFSWQIDCVSASGRLLDLPVGRAGPFAAAAPENFVVPAEGCPGQWLSLVVRAGDFRRTRSAAVSAVRVIPEPAP